MRQIREAIMTEIPAFLPAPEPTYAQIYEGAWLNDEPYYVIHRLASWPDVHGIWDCVLKWAFERTHTLRVDTHRDNHIRQHNILKHGFYILRNHLFTFRRRTPGLPKDHQSSKITLSTP